ncbi:MAG: gliding motility-associated C-terminal domain-containing protein [Bacteroidia bacterium]
MKKSLRFLVIAIFALNLFIGNKAQAQCAGSSVVENFTVGPYTCECCGPSYANPSYFCFNDGAAGASLPAGTCPATTSGACGSSASSISTSFSNPVPAGNIVTQVSLSYHAAPCGGSITTVINGVSIATDALSSSGCTCGNNIFGTLVGSNTSNFPCGLPAYNNGAGATENITFNFSGTSVCISEIIMTFCYVPANQAVPATQPAAIVGTTPVCVGVAHTYSVPAVANASSYAWTVPAGWTINSGQGTNVISATAGSAGSICVTASNFCGTSAPTCFAVTLASNSAAPTSATANPTSVCPGNPSTLTVNGGSLGTGAAWDWYTGGCNGTLVGTGTSISVSPGATTTYYVNAVGTCNTTACQSVAVTIGGTTATPGAPTGTSSVCGGSSQVYTTTGTAGATSYAWTVPAGATITLGGTGTSITVTLGSSSGNVCVTATGACGTSAAACTPITVTNAPSTPGAITGTTPVCLGSDNYSISAIAGATGYNWSVTGGGTITGASTAATVNWTTAGSYIVAVTATNTCGSSTQATFPITINSQPNITITPSSTVICSGSATTMTASGGVSYTWTPNAAIASPLIGASITVDPTVSPTVFNVTGTDGNGCKNTASQSISVNPTPTVTVLGGGGNSQTVCSGVAVAAINFNVTPAGGTISWANNNTAIGIAASGNTNIPGYTAPIVAAQTIGVITANATSSAGCNSTGSTNLSYTVTINPLPGIDTATIIRVLPGCGASTGCINNIVGSGGSGSYSYSWNGGPFTTPSNTCAIPSGTYNLQVKDVVSGCIATENITLPNSGSPPPPTVTVSPSATVCVGGSLTFSATPVAGITYNWTSTGATPTSGTGNTYSITNIPNSNPYVVTVTSTSAGCTGAGGNVNVTVMPLPPTPTLSLPTTVNDTSCQGSPPTLTVNSGGSMAVWYTIGGTFLQTGSSYTPPASLAPGTYTYSVIDSVAVPNGCINAPASANTVTLTLTVNPSPTGPILTNTINPVTECQGQTPATTLSVTPAVGSTPVWYNSTGGVVAINTNTYTPPNGTAGSSVYIVIDSSTVLPNTCTSASTGSILTVTVVVTPLPIPPVVSGTTSTTNSLCQGLPFNTLTVLPPVTTPPTTPLWYNSAGQEVATGNSYTPTSAGVYTVIDSVATPNGCTSSSLVNGLQITVIVNPSPTIDISGAIIDTAKCGQPTGGVHGIANAVGGTPVITYQWYNGVTPIPGQTSPTLTNVSNNGLYSLQVTDGNGCHALGTGTLGVNTFSVPVVVSPVASFSTNPSPATGGVPLTIIFTNQTTVGVTSTTTYVWNFGDGSANSSALSPTHTYTATNTYTATLTAYNGSCASSPVSVLIIADVPTTLIIPNVFTPNGDLKNDEFFIVNTGLTSLNCQIFNRWGQLMTTLTAPQQAWDGLAPNGDKAPDGTYMFILEAHGTDGKTYKQQGTVLLTR